MMEKVSTLKEYEKSKERAQAPRGGSKENANEEIEAEGVAVETKEMQSLGDASRVLNLNDGHACLGNKPDETLKEGVTTRAGNSGGTREPSSHKEIGLAESFLFFRYLHS